MIKKTYLDTGGTECVIVENEDGSYWSGAKATYEAMLEAAKENGIINNGGLN